jgi:hypothetical protein
LLFGYNVNGEEEEKKFNNIDDRFHAAEGTTEAGEGAERVTMLFQGKLTEGEGS